jgi:hypothetical protein
MVEQKISERYFKKAKLESSAPEKWGPKDVCNWNVNVSSLASEKHGLDSMLIS